MSVNISEDLFYDNLIST